MSGDILVFNGGTIRAEGNQLNLTDMWRAAGRPKSKRPSDWAPLPATRTFLDYLQANAGLSGTECFRVVKGATDPATWGHWQVGLAYAKYLSPEFHAWCNEVVRAHMEGRSLPAVVGPPDSTALVAIAEPVRQIMGALVKIDQQIAGVAERMTNVEGKVENMADTLAVHLRHKRKEPSDTCRLHHIDFARHAQPTCPFCDVPLFDSTGGFIGVIHHHDAASDARTNATMVACKRCNGRFNKEPTPRHTVQAYHDKRLRWRGPLFAIIPTKKKV